MERWNGGTRPIVLVQVAAEGKVDLEYSYADVVTAHLIEHTLAPKVIRDSGPDGRERVVRRPEMCFNSH